MSTVLCVIVELLKLPSTNLKSIGDITTRFFSRIVPMAASFSSIPYVCFTLFQHLRFFVPAKTGPVFGLSDIPEL